MPASPAPRFVHLVAHRGNARDFPENTLPALQSAIDLGVRFLEFDIQLSAGTVVEVSVEAMDDGDPDLWVADPSGERVCDEEEIGDDRCRPITVNQSGTYRVGVKGYSATQYKLLIEASPASAQ